jgi:hypothetical protein
LSVKIHGRWGEWGCMGGIGGARGVRGVRGVRVRGGAPDLSPACLHLSRRPLRGTPAATQTLRRPGSDSGLSAPFYLKAALRTGTMRTGGPRTQEA